MSRKLKRVKQSKNQLTRSQSKRARQHAKSKGKTGAAINKLRDKLAKYQA